MKHDWKGDYETVAAGIENDAKFSSEPSTTLRVRNALKEIDDIIAQGFVSLEVMAEVKDRLNNITPISHD